MVDVVILLLGFLCHGNFFLFLVKLEIRVVLILKGVGCYCCYCWNKSFSLWFLLLTGDCYDGGRIKDKDWDYQEPGETDPRMEKRAERPIGQAKCRVGEGIECGSKGKSSVDYEALCLSNWSKTTFKGFDISYLTLLIDWKEEIKACYELIDTSVSSLSSKLEQAKACIIMP